MSEETNQRKRFKIFPTQQIPQSESFNLNPCQNGPNKDNQLFMKRQIISSSFQQNCNQRTLIRKKIFQNSNTFQKDHRALSLNCVRKAQNINQTKKRNRPIFDHFKSNHSSSENQPLTFKETDYLPNFKLEKTNTDPLTHSSNSTTNEIQRFTERKYKQYQLNQNASKKQEERLIRQKYIQKKKLYDDINDSVMKPEEFAKLMREIRNEERNNQKKQGVQTYHTFKVVSSFPLSLNQLRHQYKLKMNGR